MHNRHHSQDTAGFHHEEAHPAFRESEGERSGAAHPQETWTILTSLSASTSLGLCTSLVSPWPSLWNLPSPHVYNCTAAGPTAAQPLTGST